MRPKRVKKFINKQPILFLDAMNMCFRMVFNNSGLRSNQSDTSVIYGSIRAIQALIEQFNPSKVVFVLEGRGSRDRRKAIYPDYKGNRKGTLPIPKEEFYAQVSELEDYLYNLGISVVKIDTYEADDVIAVMCQNISNDYGIIVSTDGDYLQLINDKINVYNPTKELLITTRNFKEIVGVAVTDFLDWKCMVGDSSDNIKGISGVGKKTATEICNFMGYTRTIEAGVENVSTKFKKIFTPEGREQFKLADKLINLSLVELPITEINEAIVQGCYDEDEIKDLFEDADMWSFLDHYDKIENSFGALE